MAQEIVGAQMRLGIKKESVEGTAVAVDTLLEVLSGDIGLVESEYHAAGMYGTRSRAAARTRANIRRVTGSISLAPNAAELAVLLPLILGADASGTTFALAELLPSFTAVKDADNGTDGKTYTYNGCKVNTATFSSEAGGPLGLQLSIEGRDEAIGNAGTFPSITLNLATGPFIHSDAVISVGGSNYPFRRASVAIDNQLDGERFFNNTTRQGLPARDRIISVELEGPNGPNLATYPTAATLAAGVAVVLTYTNTIHAVSLAISLPKVHFPRRSPTWNGRDESMIMLQGEARFSSAALDECVCTLDSTP